MSLFQLMSAQLLDEALEDGIHRVALDQREATREDGEDLDV